MLNALASRKPVSYRRAVRLLDPRRHTLYSLGDTALVLVVSAPIPPVETVCTDVQRVVLGRLPPGRRRGRRAAGTRRRGADPCPTRTKAPLADAAGKARSPTLEDYLRVAEKVAEMLGEP